MHFLLHILGIDTQQSYFYDFWSGVGTQISLLIGALSLYKHHNCHVKWCWRIGRHPLKGTPWVLCAKHHPEMEHGHYLPPDL